MFEYFQHIDHILVSIELAEAKIIREKSYWCQDDFIIIRFICNYNDQHSETAKITKIIEWLLCVSITEIKVFIEVCMYYQIWIKDFIIITQLIYILFRKSKVFIWKDSQIQAMKILKLVLITVFTLKFINYTEDADKVIYTVNVSEKDWEDNFIQVK